MFRSFSPSGQLSASQLFVVRMCIRASRAPPLALCQRSLTAVRPSRPRLLLRLLCRPDGRHRTPPAVVISATGRPSSAVALAVAQPGPRMQVLLLPPRHHGHLPERSPRRTAKKSNRIDTSADGGVAMTVDTRSSCSAYVGMASSALPFVVDHRPASGVEA
eukprot:6055116-Alexandrium_andersonii.AAC.1